jgi:hypothetical protein
VNAFDELVDDALALVWQTQPVTASFAGELAFDALLPDVAADAIAKERVQLATLAQRLDRIAVPETLGARLDARFMRTYALQAEAERTARPIFRALRARLQRRPPPGARGWPASPAGHAPLA